MENWKNNEEFRSWYLSVPKGKERNEIRKRIEDECGVRYPTVGNWLYKLCRIPKLAKDKIEEIAGKKIFTEE